MIAEFFDACERRYQWLRPRVRARKATADQRAEFERLRLIAACTDVAMLSAVACVCSAALFFGGRLLRMLW